MTPPAVDLSAYVRQIREAYHESQPRFAHRVGLAPQTISRFERGIQAPASVPTLERLARAAQEKGLTSAAEQLARAAREKQPVPYNGRMKYVGFALDELERNLFALREDGAVYAITYKRDLSEPSVKLIAQLPNEEPPDSAAV